MQRRSFLSGVVGILVALATAVPGTTHAEPTHCLWRASNATNHVYLQGSVHLLKKSHYPLPDAIEKAYGESAVLVLEADLSAAQDPALQMAILRKGMLEGGERRTARVIGRPWRTA